MNIEKITKWMDSDEGKAKMEASALKILGEHQIRELQLKRAFDKIDHRFEEVMEAVIAKYNSDAYFKRWRKMHCEPEEALYFFFFHYCEMFGREVTEKEKEEYSNMFTADMVAHKNYVFNKMNGQGTVIQIFKVV